jgi:nitroreductase
VELYDAIEKRRSIRKFKSPPTEEQLQRVLRAGGLAPSAFNRQGWDAVIVDDPALIEKIADIKYRLNRGLGSAVEGSIEDHARRQKAAFGNSTLLMVYHRLGRNERESRYDAGSAWLLMENICLAAIAEGLGTRILSFWDWAEEEVNSLLRVPEGKKQVSAINIGVPDPNEAIRPRSLKAQEKWIHRNRFHADPR